MSLHESTGRDEISPPALMPDSAELFADWVKICGCFHAASLKIRDVLEFRVKGSTIFVTDLSVSQALLSRTMLYLMARMTSWEPSYGIFSGVAREVADLPLLVGIENARLTPQQLKIIADWES